MARIDSERERRRLIDFYAGQMDGELEKVASQAYELTDLARAALRTELLRRGLSAELVETAPVVAKNVAAVKGLPVVSGAPRMIRFRPCLHKVKRCSMVRAHSG